MGFRLNFFSSDILSLCLSRYCYQNYPGGVNWKIYFLSIFISKLQFVNFLFIFVYTVLSHILFCDHLLYFLISRPLWGISNLYYFNDLYSYIFNKCLKLIGQFYCRTGRRTGWPLRVPWPDQPWPPSDRCDARPHPRGLRRPHRSADRNNPQRCVCGGGVQPAAARHPNINNPI